MRERGPDVALAPGRGLPVAVAIHVVAVWLAGEVERPERDELGLVEFEVAEVVPDEPEPEPKPEPEPEPEPEPVVPERKVEPEPKKKPKKKIDRPEPPPLADPSPPVPGSRPPIVLPPSELVPGGPVKVKPGTGPSTGGGSGSGSGKGGAKGSGSGSGEKVDPWQPRGDLSIKQQPRVVAVPELRCPAVVEAEISGTVVLMVQVRRDGSVRSARVTQGIGHGCDQVAQKALRKAKFKPAIATDGTPADYELRYEYVFELEG